MMSTHVGMVWLGALSAVGGCGETGCGCVEEGNGDMRLSLQTLYLSLVGPAKLERSLGQLQPKPPVADPKTCSKQVSVLTTTIEVGIFRSDFLIIKSLTQA